MNARDVGIPMDVGCFCTAYSQGNSLVCVYDKTIQQKHRNCVISIVNHLYTRDITTATCKAYGNTLLFYPYNSGEQEKLSEASSLYWSEMGAVVAKLHQMTSICQNRQKYSELISYDRSTFEKLLNIRKNFPGEAMVRDSMNRACDIVFADSASQKDVGIIHGKLSTSSFVSVGDSIQIRYLSHIGWGPRIFDLVSLLYSAPDPSYARAFLSAYQRGRPLQTNLLEMLSCLILYQTAEALSCFRHIETTTNGSAKLESLCSNILRKYLDNELFAFNHFSNEFFSQMGIDMF